MINRDNYEAYLLDLLEGRLSAKEQQELRDFLLSHPDCYAAPEELGSLQLEKNHIAFPDISQLKKELPGPETRLTDRSFDMFSIARMEGDLDPEQEEAHEVMMAGNKTLIKEWRSWKDTILYPEKIPYPNKSELKRRMPARGRMIWIGIAAAAAAVTLLLILFTPGPALTETEIAEAVIEIRSDDGGGLMTEPDREEAVQNEQEENVSAEQEVITPASGGPALFSIRRGQVSDAEDTGDKGADRTESSTDSLKQAGPEHIGQRPVRITENMPDLSSLMVRATYDRIEPLVVQPASVHLSSLSLSQLREIELQALFEDFTQENNFSLWTIANAGFRGINRIAGTEMSLMASRDDDGTVSGIRFSSRRFNFATPLNSSE